MFVTRMGMPRLGLDGEFRGRVGGYKVGGGRGFSPLWPSPVAGVPKGARRGKAVPSTAASHLVVTGRGGLAL